MIMLDVTDRPPVDEEVKGLPHSRASREEQCWARGWSPRPPFSHSPQCL